ncbi:MAG: DNA polymerase III subunit alpha [Candidatus Kapaibacteriales bacterium]
MEFIHLHNHTHYSLLDAAATVDDLVRAAKSNGHPSVALTDHGVMFGALEFYKKARKEGIKPIIGFEAYMATGSRFDKTLGKTKSRKKNYYHLILLAKNKEGYKNLIKLTTYAHLEGFYYKPRIDRELLQKYHKGLIVCSGCLNGVVNAHIINNEIDKAKEQAKFYQELFEDDFYIEIQNHHLPEDEAILRWAPVIARELGIKLVATNDVHYIEKDHALAHNVYLNIKTASENGSEKKDITQLRYRSPELYYRSTEEMYEALGNFPDALQNTMEIAQKCDLQLEEKFYMPSYQIPNESKARTLEEFLREETYRGIKERYFELTPEILKRVNYELDVICKMNFAAYFLIVADFVRSARQRGIRVGPGRGSVAGSIVAYALGITNIDPLKYGLLFERFLNPDRISMPDIDIDFCDTKRDMIIEYVKQKYGENSVAQIITFGKLSSRAVLKDVGRILGIHHSEINKITSKIPVVMGKVTPLAEALELPDLKELKETNDETKKKLIEYSLLLEGFYRNTSIHAAGVVIAPGDISDYVPLYLQSSGASSKQEITTQYSMNDLETAGLIKMDFLGLRTLSIIDSTLEMIKQNHGIDIDIDKIDLNDEVTFQLFSEGKTLAVFQFESNGMQEYLRQLKPKNILELSDMNALYRPGPMQNIPEYIDRKYGRKKIEYLHPLMENSLKQTYGIIVYQEQVMQLARDIAGFTLSEADNLRRAMGKKKQDEMLKLKPKFIEGAKLNGIEDELANEIFELISKFANYGFNKSHSLAYSLLAYQTAWLKAHYPAEFLASNMNAEINDTNKLPPLILEAKNLGIEVLPPDVNRSFSNFIAIDSKTIVYGLAGIKNVGARVEDTIVGARKEQPFKSFLDFVRRVDTKIVNRKVLEALICAGAFDSISHGQRRALYESIDIALEYARRFQATQNSALDILFVSEANENGSYIVEPKLPDVPEWTLKEKLAREKEFLNFYFSGHPLQRYENLIKILSTYQLDSDSKPEGAVRICGILSEVNVKMDRNKQKFAFITIEDFYSRAECIVFADTYSKYFSLLVPEEIVTIVGKIENGENSSKIIVQEIYSIDDAIDRFVIGVKISLRDDDSNISKIESLAEMCADPTSSIPFVFVLVSDDNQRVFRSEKMNFRVTEETLKKLADLFGKNNIKILVQ